MRFVALLLSPAKRLKHCLGPLPQRSGDVRCAAGVCRAPKRLPHTPRRQLAQCAAWRQQLLGHSVRIIQRRQGLYTGLAFAHLCRFSKGKCWLRTKLACIILRDALWQVCLPVRDVDLGYNLVKTHDGASAFLVVDHDEEDMISARAPIGNIYAPGNPPRMAYRAGLSWRTHIIVSCMQGLD